jgi:ankyrin repeat protein
MMSCTGLKWWPIFLLFTIDLAASNDIRLVDAAKNQKKDEIRALLKQHIDVDAPYGDGTTALHWAAHWNDLEMAGLLIDGGANVNAQTDLGVTPLYLAAEIGSTAMTEKLFSAGANPNITAATGVSPLMLASRAGAPDVVRVLLAHKAEMNAREKQNEQTALMWATAQGHKEVVRILAKARADVNVRSKVIPMLVNRGGEGDSTKSVEWVQSGGSTALLFAARRGDIESAKILLEFGANVNDTSADGNSALVIAAHSGNGEFARFLLEKGADPNAVGAGYTVLHAAVLKDDLELLKASLAHGANPNIPLTKGTPIRRQGPDFFLPASLIGATPFLLAAKYASVDMMHALVAAGADTKLATSNGTTPLMAAANGDRRHQMGLTGGDDDYEPQGADTKGPDVIKYLLDLGADVNAANQAGDTALHVAVAGKANTIIPLLVERGAILDTKNKRGQTPLALASVGARRGAAARKAQNNSTADLLRKLGAKD